MFIFQCTNVLFSVLKINVFFCIFSKMCSVTWKMIFFIKLTYILTYLHNLGAESVRCGLLIQKWRVTSTISRWTTWQHYKFRPIRATAVADRMRAVGDHPRCLWSATCDWIVCVTAKPWDVFLEAITLPAWASCHCFAKLSLVTIY